jgi:dipeptidyl aminopeptidase/acylaminoacyl peptidase
LTFVSASRNPEDVYRAYLNRDELVWGGTVPPSWTLDGTGYRLLEGAIGNIRALRIDLNTGEAAPMEPQTDGVERKVNVDSFSSALGWKSSDELTPRMWKRYDYLSAIMDVPEQLSPSREWFASVRNNNIMVRAAHARDGLDQQLTSDGTPDCFWDIEGLRFRILSGRRITFSAVTPWSPDSLVLLAYRRDITDVFRIPRLNWLKPFEDVEYLPLQKAGAKLDRVQPVFVDIRSAKQTPVQLGDVEDRYVQLLCWHPNGTEALIIVYTRDFKRLDIYTTSRDTGAARLLLTESAATFVKIQHDAMFGGEHGFRLLPDGSGFLWLSTRDGWNHLYRYDMSGKLVGQLTQGDWPVYDVSHIGADGYIYLTAAIDTARPYDVHVCRVPLKGGKIEQLTREIGIHSPVFAPSGLGFLDTHSTVDRPTRTDLVRADGTQLRVLSRMDISRLEAVGYTPAEEFIVKAADGATDLWGVMYKPFDFDPSLSYPVIEYIYAGPQTIEAPRFFAIDKTVMTTMKAPWALAQLGYIVVCLDARGTPGRSKAFHDVVYGNWTAGIPDHVAAMCELTGRHSWMDADRVGVMGHSWGGYFSTCALLQAPDTYHAAVAYAPGYDPWDVIIHEPYLGLPQTNRAAYDAANIIKQARGIRRPLMIVAGSSDYIVINSAMKMTWALIEAGIDHEFVVVPQAFHQFVGAEENYLLVKLTGWFNRHVKHRLAGD